MITSMTGFGAAEGVVGGYRLAIELRAVNHRFFNPVIKLPGALMRWEGDVREALRKRFARGHLTLMGRAERDAEHTVAVNEPRFAAYVEQLRALRDRYGLAGDVDLATVLRLPDVLSGAVSAEASEGDVAGSLDELLPLVDRAANSLEEMRRTEGASIAAFLTEHLGVIEGALDRIERRAPERLVEQRDRLRAAVAELAGGVAVDPQRLAHEIAILADRLDVAEEISRFRAHIAAFRAAVLDPSPAPVGKRLGFLIQEMLRETNTTGSKANDAAILADVVVIKEELERLREQTENVE